MQCNYLFINAWVIKDENYLSKNSELKSTMKTRSIRCVNKKNGLWLIARQETLEASLELHAPHLKITLLGTAFHGLRLHNGYHLTSGIHLIIQSNNLLRAQNMVNNNYFCLSKVTLCDTITQGKNTRPVSGLEVSKEVSKNAPIMYLAILQAKNTICVWWLSLITCLSRTRYYLRQQLRSTIRLLTTQR